MADLVIKMDYVSNNLVARPNRFAGPRITQTNMIM